MKDNRIRLTHPQKKGVVARVGEAQLQAHLDDGWVVEVPVVPIEPKKTVTRRRNKVS